MGGVLQIFFKTIIYNKDSKIVKLELKSNCALNVGPKAVDTLRFKSMYLNSQVQDADDWVSGVPTPRAADVYFQADDSTLADPAAGTLLRSLAFTKLPVYAYGTNTADIHSDIFASNTTDDQSYFQLANLFMDPSFIVTGADLAVVNTPLVLVADGGALAVRFSNFPADLPIFQDVDLLDVASAVGGWLAFDQGGMFLARGIIPDWVVAFDGQGALMGGVGCAIADLDDVVLFTERDSFDALATPMRWVNSKTAVTDETSTTGDVGYNFFRLGQAQVQALAQEREEILEQLFAQRQKHEQAPAQRLKQVLALRLAPTQKQSQRQALEQRLSREPVQK